MPSFQSSRKDFSASGASSLKSVQPRIPGAPSMEPSFTSGLRASSVESRTLHRSLEALEHQALGASGHTLLDLPVPQLQEEVVERNADRTRLRARAAQRGGVGKVLRLLVSLEQRRDDGPYRAGVGRAVGVPAGLPIYGADVKARAAADAVEGLFVLRAQELRAP